MNKKNKYLIVAIIALALAFIAKGTEAFVGYDLALERYILLGVAFPLLVMLHFIHHLRNPDFYEDKKEYAFLRVMYKYLLIPSCFLYIFAGILFG